MRKGLWRGAMVVALLSWALPSGAVGVSGQGTWQTTLQGRDLDGNLSTVEAYYDTVLDITWLADANYAKTSGYYYTDEIDGRMTWSHATGWAAGLSYSGSWGTASDWRLPDTDPINGSTYNSEWRYDGSTDRGYNQSAPGTVYAGSTGSEMAHMFFNTLGNLSYCHPTSPTAASCLGSQPDWGLKNTGPFSNLQSKFYWSGTEYASASSAAWFFNFHLGYQNDLSASSKLHAWAVHPGDVGAVAPVPLPAAVWLLISGLAGVAVVGRRRNASKAA